MAWNDTGEDRVRKFKAYQELETKKWELERKYNASNERIVMLTEELERQREIVAKLAEELKLSKEMVKSASNRPPPHKSGTSLNVREVLDQLAQLIEEKAG